MLGLKRQKAGAERERSSETHGCIYQSLQVEPRTVSVPTPEFKTEPRDPGMRNVPAIPGASIRMISKFKYSDPDSAATGWRYDNLSSSALAARRSVVSNPSENQS